jgi:hypothetical protein
MLGGPRSWLLSSGGLGRVEIMRRGGPVRDKTRLPRIAPLAQEVIDEVVALTGTEPPHEAQPLDRSGDGQAMIE